MEREIRYVLRPCDVKCRHVDVLHVDMLVHVDIDMFCIATQAQSVGGTHPYSGRSKSKDRDDSLATPSATTLHPVISTTMQTLILSDIRHVMDCHVRAAVLAERGRLWTLLQNVARSLWNVISSLVFTLAWFSGERKDAILSAVYSMACKPLYFVASGLVEVLRDCPSATPFPQTSSLTFTPELDDVNGVGVAAIRQVVFLALHTLCMNQHWEKVMALGFDFDTATK